MARLHICAARTKHSGKSAKSMDTGAPLFPISFRELAEIPNVQPPTFYHSLVVELGAAILRYREFINFHGERVCPVYLLACEYALSRGLEPQTQ